jgi:hypothetical protein
MSVRATTGKHIYPKAYGWPRFRRVLSKQSAHEFRLCSSRQVDFQPSFRELKVIVYFLFSVRDATQTVNISVGS